jgi:hypothetical protein
MMNLALVLLAFVGAAKASDTFTYGYSICKDGTVHNCNADEPVYCESLCFDHKGFAEHFDSTLQVPYRNRRSPHTWHEGLTESFNQASRHYEDAVKPRLEDARKAEEFRKEKARKAEEFLKEKERKDCLAKMTYPVKVWACPFGNYVSEPTSCEKDGWGRSVAEHAVEVDTGFLILPPGESCTGRNWEDLTHANQLKYRLDKANASCNSWKGGPDFAECSDEDKASALYLASEKALAKQRLAYHIRRQTLPYDCLAGVCLNAPATRNADKLVTVSEVVMHRTVEVCSGRVVEISVSAGWIAPGYGDYVDILSGAEHTTYNGDWPSSQHVGQLKTEMEALGWQVNYGPEEFSTAGHPDKRGIRSIELGASGGRWWVALTTHHADKDALCAPKRQQGL